MTGPEIIEAVSNLLRRYVVFVDDDQVLTLTLWVLHTYAIDAADTTPYMLIMCPEKRSGKTRLLEVLELLVADGWRVAGVSEAVLFRKIDQRRVTLLFDELDAVFGTYQEKTESVRGVINAGSRRGSTVSRCVGPNHDVVDFSVFCPKCLAGIATSNLPDTIRDRAVPIGLHRKVDEPVERFRFRTVQKEAEAITAEIAEWAETHLEALTDAMPEIPTEINDRAAEGWEPIFAIADCLGEEIAARARKAAINLSSEEDLEEASWGTQLLADIRESWTDELTHTMPSANVCSNLGLLEDRPWRNWGKDRPKPGFNPRDLARLLRPYGIRPKTIRVANGSTAKGYHRSQFEDAWRRYALKEDNDA